ncbi:MAG TPA: rod-binding protein [bacterium]|nr:rod-binding protein [bacterium]
MQLNVLPDFTLQRGKSELDALRGKAVSLPTQRKRLEKAAKEFEGIMLEMMVREMRKNVPQSPLFGKSNAHDIYTDMLDSQYVHLMTERGGFGLAKLLVRQLGPDLHGAGKQPVSNKPAAHLHPTLPVRQGLHALPGLRAQAAEAGFPVPVPKPSYRP